MSAVKVRLHGERRWHFLGTGGCLARLWVHAAMFPTPDTAIEAARDVLTSNPTRVAAVRVDDDGHTLFRLGEPTPPRTAPPVYGAGGGYRYLVGVTASGRPVFHVTDDEGQWSHVSWDIAEQIYDEAHRAGLTARPLRVHGSTCAYATAGFRFIQESRRR